MNIGGHGWDLWFCARRRMTVLARMPRYNTCCSESMSYGNGYRWGLAMGCVSVIG